MLNTEWPAKDYAVGAFIQDAVATPYLKSLIIHPQDAVLDVGCGDAAFSLKIMKQYPMASFLGIDASNNMLQLARERAKAYPVATFKKIPIEDINFENQFEVVLSFWCLQWTTSIEKSLKNLYTAMKPGGRFLAIFPTGDEPFMQAFLHLKANHQWPVLEKFKPPVDYSQFGNLEKIGQSLPFNSFNVQRIPVSLKLPSLETFRKFVQGISFYQGQVPAEQIQSLNDAMVEDFASISAVKYSGEYWFDFSYFEIQGFK